jgi:hypothetical protein
MKNKYFELSISEIKEGVEEASGNEGVVSQKLKTND